ncbi:MAG TPA: FtsW/RodA/SpoVE family cell cycle protein, partial [Leptospiraceae bacterium]|nr:FtsW/RodA/SpoVE family cell cycle protein [Leptospiraceae bacterium]
MINRYKLDVYLLGAAVVVVLAGIFTLYTQEYQLAEGSGRWYKQLIFFGLGLIICLGIRRMNYQVLEAYAVPAYLGSLFLLMLVLVFGATIKGAKSWFRLGPINVEPSEIARLATILLLAKYLQLKERDMGKIPTLLIAFGICLLPMLLIVVQPAFGDAFAFTPILLSMLFIAGADMYHIGSVVVFFSVAISVPLYIEYHNITLVDPLVGHLSDLGKTDLLPAVRLLKTDIWKFAAKGKIPVGIEGADKDYLVGLAGNQNLRASLVEAVNSVRSDSGGLLLRLLENDTLLLALGIFFALSALVLLILRLTQGTSLANLRKLYIPFGVIGMSLLSAVAVHTTFSFKYHQIARVTAFINPDRFPRDLAYQTRASRAAIGSGELSGRGIFQGDMTTGERPLVPEAYTDFIFTAWCERTGFLGGTLILLLLLSIPLRGMLVSFESRDRFASLLSAGISFMFFFHILMNVGIAVGLLPVT